MLQYELAHDDDVLGRTEAVDRLRARPADPTALAALIAASHGDRSWFVRQRGVRALGNWIADSSRASSSTAQSVAKALLDATHDNDSRIRASAAQAVGVIASSSLKTPELSARLRALATTDASLFVRASALASYVRVEGNAALPLAREMLAPEIWRDVIRVQVVDALKTLNSAEAADLVRRYSPPQQE
jgi:HEAT repeat protein